MQYLASSLQQPSNPLFPSPTELIVGTFAFFVVFGVLGKVLLPRITKILQERTDQIEGGLQRAKDAQDEAARTLAEYRQQLAEARHEAARLREEAREEGARILADLRARGEAERQRIVGSADAQIDSDRQQALISLRAEIGALAVELASKVVGESLEDEARQRRTVDRFLAQLEGQSASEAVAKATP
jgi:F-type H+-transporting ATPase subunit b